MVAGEGCEFACGGGVNAFSLFTFGFCFCFAVLLASGVFALAFALASAIC
jgi:hypothetical protein